MEPTQNDDRKKVVNTEEQNEPVNPGDRVDEETVSSGNEQPNNTSETEEKKREQMPDRGKDPEKPR